MYDFDTEVTRRYSQKHSEIPAPKILPFWVADMDFAVAPEICAAIDELVSSGVFGGYSNLPDELYANLCTRLKNLFDWDVLPNQVIVKLGLVPFLHSISRDFAGKDGKVLVATPAYYHLFNAPDWGGQQTVLMPLKLQDKRYYIDFDQLEAHFKNGVKIFNFCNPQNPSGRVWERNELLKIAELCLKYNVLIVSDEIHSELTFEGHKHIPIASLGSEIAENCITLYSTSKTFNIPNFGASFCITANLKLKEKIAAAMRGVVPDVSLLGIVATNAALSKADAWKKDLLSYLTNNREIINRFFANKPDFELMPTESTYLAWIKAKNIDPAKLNETMLNWGLKISDGKVFKGDGYFRLNFGCPKSRLVAGLNLIEQGLSTL